MSGTTVAETAKIRGEQVTAMLASRLKLLLEGFELHGAIIDEELKEQVVAEMTALREQWMSNAFQAMQTDHVLKGGPVSPSIYFGLLEQRVRMRPNEVRTVIDRARLKPKTQGGGGVSIVYHVQGNNNRWLNNSEDHSVNVVTQSSDQIFANLRHKIETGITVGDEQKDIVEKLTALDKAQDSPTFKQRYTEFIASAANHMELVAPFIPALTEMLHKTL